MAGSKANPSLEYLTSISKIFSTPRPQRVVALAPSLLAADFANLEADLRRAMRKKVYWTHLDVMDGHFVPNISIGVPVVRSVRAISSRLFLDAHLMISEPLRYLEAFVEAGADLVTIHAEAVDNLSRALDAVHRAGVRAGVCLKPATPVSVLAGSLKKIDLVLIMTVEPGFGGQSFMPAPLSKVRELALLREREGLKFMIQIDGGIGPKTAHLAVAAGANVLVAGSALFGSGRVDQNIDKLIGAAMAP